MGQDSPTSSQLNRYCQGDFHVSGNKFECMYEHCSMKPYLCHTCAERSDVDPEKYICKLCKVTETMDNFDSSKLQIDKNHTIKQVASVSFNKDKQAFMMKTVDDKN